MRAQTNKERAMRKRITKKAFEIMSKKGIEQVSMREIAQSIGVTKPVLYYYFKNKEELCRHIILDVTKSFEQSLEQFYKRGAGIEELAGFAVDKQSKFLQQNPKMAKFMLHLLSYSLNHRVADRESEESKSRNKKIYEKLAAKAEKEKMLPKGSSGDLKHLLYALTAHILINMQKQELNFDADFGKRMVKIIFAGIRSYYKGNRK